MAYLEIDLVSSVELTFPVGNTLVHVYKVPLWS